MLRRISTPYIERLLFPTQREIVRRPIFFGSGPFPFSLIKTIFSSEYKSKTPLYDLKTKASDKEQFAKIDACLQSFDLQRPLVSTAPKWLEGSFFKRISPKAKDRIASKTANIYVSSSQVRAFKKRQFDTDSIFKTPDWIYIAFKAFSEGFLNDYEIADLTLYDSLHREPSFQCHYGSEAVQIIKKGFQLDPGKHSHFVAWKDIEQLFQTLPEEERHVYSYRHPLDPNALDYREISFYNALKLNFFPMIMHSETECEPILFPPFVFHNFLLHHFGEGLSVVPKPVLGFLKTEDISNVDTRVMSIQHPELTEIHDKIHECRKFTSQLQTLYLHDMYHLIICSSIPCRKSVLDLIQAHRFIMENDKCLNKLEEQTKQHLYLILKDHLLDLDFRSYLGSKEQGLTPMLNLMEFITEGALHRDKAFCEKTLRTRESCIRSYNKSLNNHIQQQIRENNPAYRNLAIDSFDQNKGRRFPIVGNSV